MEGQEAYNSVKHALEVREPLSVPHDLNGARTDGSQAGYRHIVSRCI